MAVGYFGPMPPAKSALEVIAMLEQAETADGSALELWGYRDRGSSRCFQTAGG